MSSLVPHNEYSAPGLSEDADVQRRGVPETDRNAMSQQPSNLQHVDLPPVIKRSVIEIANPTLEEKVLEVPHVQYIERIEEVPSRRIVDKTVHVPAVEVTERVIEIPKPIKEQQIVEVPQLQVADHITEVPQYIIQEKIVERPNIILQERIIPIPKRRIEEKIVEIPEDQFNEIIRRQYGPEAEERLLSPRLPLFEKGDQVNLDDYALEPEGPGTERQWRRFHQEIGQPLPEKENLLLHTHAENIVEIPQVQHVYRNIFNPVTRHVPKPVEVPLPHYKSIPVERIIDRNVPIPVELEVVQEFRCPRIQANYVEVPVPVPVRRAIEKPIPADAMFNSAIMEAYLSGAPSINAGKYVQACGFSPPTVPGSFDADDASTLPNCCIPQSLNVPIPASKMSAAELENAGISTEPELSDVKAFKSRGFSLGGINLSRSQNFFARGQTLQGQQQSSL